MESGAELEGGHLDSNLRNSSLEFGTITTRLSRPSNNLAFQHNTRDNVNDPNNLEASKMHLTDFNILPREEWDLMESRAEELVETDDRRTHTRVFRICNI
ncbi:hypothetical protein TNCV_2679051 [Trichonephila clavipes]|nr:hypothetical protein TNCV_2679051 [Trichonephila clavipes]